MQNEIAKKVEQLAQKARKDFGVALDGFQATFTNRGKARIVSYKRVNGKTVAVFNAKWLTDENRNAMLANTVPHIVARRVATESSRSEAQVAVWLGATSLKANTGLVTPDTCKRVAKSRNWVYKDSSGKYRSVSTRLHNRMQREGVTYRFKDNGASIGRNDFVSHS